MAELVDAREGHLQQILAATHALWNDGLLPGGYAQFWEAQRRTPWGAAHLGRTALIDEGRVISSAKRYDLSARIDGRIRRILGIGAVFTMPEARGQGAARHMLELLLEAAEAEGYEFALLFSEIDPQFYERMDFVPVPLLEQELRVTRRDGAPAVLVRAGDDRDIPALAEISATRSASARVALDRSEDFIRFGLSRRRLLAGLGRAGLRETEFFVTEEGHQAVAYLVTTVQDGRWFIEDAGDRDPSGARLGAMLQVLLARTPHLQAPPICAWLPHDFIPPQVTVTQVQPTTAVMMLRPLKDRTLPMPPLEASQVTYCRLDYF